MKKLEPSYIAGGNVKWCGHYGKVWQFLKKLNVELPYDTANPLLDIDPREMEAYGHTESCP